MHRRALLALVLLAACGGGSDATSPAASIVGRFTLQSVNGQALPALIGQDATGRIEVVSDAYSFNADGTWSEVGTLRGTVTATGVVITSPQADNGTYSVAGNTVTLRSATTGASTGTWSGNTITVVGTGVSLIYTR